MNQTTHETEKQNWMMRLLTAASEKWLAWICQSEMGLCPHETRMFTYYSGLGSNIGLEEAMMCESIAYMKWDEGV